MFNITRAIKDPRVIKLDDLGAVASDERHELFKLERPNVDHLISAEL